MYKKYVTQAAIVKTANVLGRTQLKSTDISEFFSADIDGKTQQDSKDGGQGISSSKRCDERNGAERGWPNGNSEIVSSRHNDNDFSFYHDSLPVHLMLNKDSSQSLNLCNVKGSRASIKEKVKEVSSWQLHCAREGFITRL